MVRKVQVRQHCWMTNTVREAVHFNYASLANRVEHDGKLNKAERHRQIHLEVFSQHSQSHKCITKYILPMHDSTMH